MNFLWSELVLYSWRDVGELVLLGLLIHYFFAWLARDAQMPWVISITGYTVIWAALFYLQLPVLWLLMSLLTPLCIVAAVCMHREQLQKYLVTYRRPTDGTMQPATLEQLMGSLLHALSGQKTVTCVIEGSDELERLIVSPLRLQALPHKDLVRALITIDFPENSFWWIDRTGSIVAIGCSWRNSPTGVVDYAEITNRLDCMVFQLHPSRTVDLYMQGQRHFDVSPVHALRMMLVINTPHDDRK